jgi:hypothetical protein
MATYSQFFSDVLTQMGLPDTQSNLIALGAVAHLEGLNDRFNPLNSVVQSGNSTQFNSVGVQDYKSYANGVAGTVALLQGSHWDGVVNALREGNSTGNVLAAFTSAYTWDPGVQFSASSGGSVLNQSIGNGPSGTLGTDGSPAPVAPSVTASSITSGEISAIQSFLLKPTINDTGATTPDQLAQYIYFVESGKSSKTYTWAQLTSTAQGKGWLITFYKDYLGTNIVANGTGSLTNPKGSPLGDVATGAVGAAEGITSWTAGLTAFFNWFSQKKNWARIGEGSLGAAIIIFALIILFADAKTIGQAAKVAVA